MIEKREIKMKYTIYMIGCKINKLTRPLSTADNEFLHLKCKRNSFV
jgi:hypothetical protein